jgi:EmrB/QacA subfamily drug resistance transporter
VRLAGQVRQGQVRQGQVKQGQVKQGQVKLGQAPGRWVITATVLGSGMALLDSTAVNVALPTIGRQFAASIGGLQWIVSGYTLTLAALILLGGSLGDRFGRRRVFLVGVTWFALSSALCGAAPGVGLLVAARLLQGAGGALLVPGSLAIIQASFDPADRARAIGAWSGMGGLAAAAGPLLGGWLVVSASWRWVFFLNIPVAAAVIAVAVRHVPESRDDGAVGRFDVLGAFLAALGLAGTAYALIGGPAGAIAGAVGVAAFAAFIVVERIVPGPMLPLGIFAARQFRVINVITFCVYSAFVGLLFLLVLELQAGEGFSALAAGSALLPVTFLMLVLSPRTAALAQRVGPRWLITGGLLGCAVAALLMRRVTGHASYLADVLPAVTLFGLGLSFVVAPLTATVLASADVRHAGVASAVNNAVARVAGLLAVAGLPAAVGLTAAGYHSPALLGHAFGSAMLICAGLLAVAAILAAALVDDNVLHPEPARPVPKSVATLDSPVGATPLEPGRRELTP